VIGRTTGLVAAMLALGLFVYGCERSSPSPDVKAAPAESAKPSVVAKPQAPDKPNILFVLVDALRADKLGRYGRVPSITPTIDAVADEGVTFERPIAQAPWTQPSIASMFSSYNPSVHRVFSYRQVPKSPGDAAHKVVVFRDDFQTLAECLKEGGYETAAFVANPFVLEPYGFAQGFDHFDTSMASPEALVSGDVVNEAALTWLDQRDVSKPFFLYLHYMDVHGPYDAGPEYVDDLLDEVEKNPAKRLLTPVERSQLGYLRALPKDCPNPQKHQRLMRFREYWIARYEAGVREFDDHFASLRASLSELGLWDDAYVVFTADHGEALCEHTLWSHGYSTHHSDLHVPLILRWPGELPSGKWVSGTVRLIDVMPTLLTQLSLDIPYGIQGASLLSLIDGKPLVEPLVTIAEGVKIGPQQRAIYRNYWKLMVTLETGRKQLFNLYDDYDELIDLSVREPDRVTELSAVLDNQVEVNARLAVEFASDRVTVPAEEVERLKSLGYVGD
jgi:arylsulfatase A-like enzyme